MPLPLILCYHAVSSTWPSPLAVSEDLLSAHVARLRRRGYTGLTLAECERLRIAGELPRRCVVFTFDDGYVSTLRAKPILDRAGFPATVFVVTAYAESGEPLSWPGMDVWARSEHASELLTLSWSDLERLVTDGWEVGSHTVTHPHLTELSDGDLEQELVESKRTVVSQLGVCDTIAYPFGLADARVAAVAARAGYLAGVTLSAAHRQDEPHRRPRVGLYPCDDGLRMHAKLSPIAAAARRTALANLAERLRERWAIRARRAKVSRG